MAKHGLTVAKATKEEFKRVWDWLHTMEALFDGRGMFSTEEEWMEEMGLNQKKVLTNK